MHVLVWGYRGSAQVSAGGASLEMEEGCLAWLPAGIPNVVHMGSGSLVLPVGARVGRAQHSGGPVRLRTEGLNADTLLGASAQEYDPLFSRQTALVDGLFYTYLASGSDGDVQDSRLMTRLLELFRRDPSSERTVEEWAQHLGCSRPELTGALAGDGPGVFRQWRTSMRMGIARRLLFAGVPVTGSPSTSGTPEPVPSATSSPGTMGLLRAATGATCEASMSDGGGSDHHAHRLRNIARCPVEPRRRDRLASSNPAVNRSRHRAQ